LKPSIQLIVTDIDGTLLNSHHELSPRNAQALRAAITQGVGVILATGRPRTAKTVELIHTLELTTPGIFLQGGMICDAEGNILHQTAMDTDAALGLVRLGEMAGYTTMLYCGLDILIKEHNVHTLKLQSYSESPYQAVGDLQAQITPGRVNKVIFLDEPENIPGIRAHLSQHLNGSTKLVQTLPMAIEVLPNTVSKGAALTWLLDDLGISPEEVMALGDAENDIEMLQVAGLGVAVANAMPATLAAADQVTASNDEDGVALAVEQFVLS
jgi:Cof subfamily protein (haloacid dehalogenase superfamily)